MKKLKLLSIVLIIALLAACGTAQAGSMANDPVAEPQTRQEETLAPRSGEIIDTTTTVSGEISEEEAVSIALEDAGIQESAVTRLRVHRSMDDFVPEYEVEFYVDRQEYDYDIAVSDGKILSKDFDIENDHHPSESLRETGTGLTEEEAIKLVLAKVPGAVESDVRLHRDRDDGRDIYEGSLVYEKMEYDFEIDANTGTILEWEKESVYD